MYIKYNLWYAWSEPVYARCNQWEVRSWVDRFSMFIYTHFFLLHHHLSVHAAQTQKNQKEEMWCIIINFSCNSTHFQKFAILQNFSNSNKSHKHTTLHSTAWTHRDSKTHFIYIHNLYERFRARKIWFIARFYNLFY